MIKLARAWIFSTMAGGLSGVVAIAIDLPSAQIPADLALVCPKLHPFRGFLRFFGLFHQDLRHTEQHLKAAYNGDR